MSSAQTQTEQERPESQIKVYDPRKRCQVTAGYIKDNYFCKPVVRKRHFLRVLSGYALQKEVVQELVRRNVTGIRIIEDNKKTREVSLQDFVTKAVAWERGHGEQFVIPEKYLKSSDEAYIR